MDSARTISSGELSPKAQKLLDAVRRGEVVFLGEEGQTEAALLDIVDYRILRAVMHYYATQPSVDTGTGLPERKVVGEPEQQERYDQVLAYYLREAISLSRAAELLDRTPSDLRARFDRLDVPQRVAPSDSGEAKHDAQTALRWPDAVR